MKYSPGMKGWFNIQKSANVNHYTKKNQMIKLMEKKKITKTPFDKLKQPDLWFLEMME